MVTRAVPSSLRHGPMAFRRRFEPVEPLSFAIGSPYKRGRGQEGRDAPNGASRDVLRQVIHEMKQYQSDGFRPTRKAIRT